MNSLRRFFLAGGFAYGLACSHHAAPVDAPPIVPRETIRLFNGRDLAPFYTWLKVHRYDDPDRVFTVVDQIDGAPAIRISGQHDGGLVTRERYANYRLVTEFRWGVARWAPRLARARNSGIFVHCQGEDGNRDPDFRSPWGSSLEAQVMEGRMGENLLIQGYERGKSEKIGPKLRVPIARAGNKNYWSPDGVLAEFDRGAIGWLHQDSDWKDVHDFRSPTDIEKPVGDWNRFEIVCTGGDKVFLLNGVRVNEGRDGTFQEGRILLQSESNEIHFFRIDLLPLDKDSNARSPR